MVTRMQEADRAQTSKELSWSEGSVVVEGLRLRYTEIGQGQPLLLVHGLLVDHRDWRTLLPRLATSFRCIALDLPGFGRSEVPSLERFDYRRESFARVLAAFIASLGVAPVDLCAHSMGGGIALALAQHSPELLRRLTIIDGVCYPFPLPLLARFSLLPGVGEFTFRYLYNRAVFRHYFRHDVFAGHPAMDAQLVDSYYDAFDRPLSRRAGYASMRNMLETLPDLATSLAKVQLPVSLIWGTADRLVPFRAAEQLVKALPDALLHPIQGAGHAAHIEHPDRAVALIEAHHLGPREK